MTARENPLINETDTNRRKKSPPNSSVKNDRIERRKKESCATGFRQTIGPLTTWAITGRLNHSKDSKENRVSVASLHRVREAGLFITELLYVLVGL